MAWAAPGPHPDPPHDLARRHLPLRPLHVEWYRVYRCARDPRFFGRTGMFRFDAPAAEYGVLYMARSHEGAFIETFGTVIRARAARNILDERTVNERCWRRISTDLTRRFGKQRITRWWMPPHQNLAPPRGYQHGPVQLKRLDGCAARGSATQ